MLGQCPADMFEDFNIDGTTTNSGFTDGRDMGPSRQHTT